MSDFLFPVKFMSPFPKPVASPILSIHPFSNRQLKARGFISLESNAIKKCSACGTIKIITKSTL